MQATAMPHGTLPLLYTFHFYLFGLIAVVSALLFVTRKSPVAAALWLVNTMFSLAALYVMLDAQFIGAIQVLVYAGAIMVVFLFVIMLLNSEGPDDDIRASAEACAGAVAWMLAESSPCADAAQPDIAAGVRGEIAATGARLPAAPPSTILLAFEVTSVLLLAAIVGAVVLGKQRGGPMLAEAPSSRPCCS